MQGGQRRLTRLRRRQNKARQAAARRRCRTGGSRASTPRAGTRTITTGTPAAVSGNDQGSSRRESSAVGARTTLWTTMRSRVSARPRAHPASVPSRRPTRIEAAAPSSAGAGSDCMQPASDQMTMSGLSTSTPNDVFFRVRLTTNGTGLGIDRVSVPEESARLCGAPERARLTPFASRTTSTIMARTKDKERLRPWPPPVTARSDLSCPFAFWQPSAAGAAAMPARPRMRGSHTKNCTH